MDRLEVFTLGGVRILRAGELVTGLSTRKAEALLIYVAGMRRPQPREVLADLLWDERSQSQALSNLRGVLSNLRQTLGESLLINRAQVQINPEEPLWLDAAELEDCLQAVRQQGKLTATKAAQISEVLKLYRGDFLAGFSVYDCRGFEEWVVRERERLHRLAVEGFSDLVEYALEQRDYPTGIAQATRLLELDPLLESAYRQLMRLFAESGQRGAALGQYETCRKLLKVELGVEPEAETRDLFAQIRAGKLSKAADLQQDFPALVTSMAHPHNLPAELTSFVGREKEIAELKKILIDQGARLMTITGAGGIGKTRLALRTAQAVIDSYKDGVWLVELVSLSDGAFVPQATAHTLKIREVAGQPVMEVLREFLSKKHLLLILDNCEHLIQAIAELACELLRACPELQILATSREILGVEGEVGYICPSLLSPIESAAYVESAVEDDETLITSPAVQLFAERAKIAFPTFCLSKNNAATIAGICQRLDGIPLAIELAAARVRMLTVEQIATRLDDVFRLLTGGSRLAFSHHQTLKALIDWSYNLLPNAEQTLFRRLSVFAGGWDLAATEAVGAGDGIDDWEVLDLMAQLESKSLILVEPTGNGENRYRMLEPFRQYAHERLVEANEQTGLEKRHLQYFMCLVENAEPLLWGKESEEWIRRLSVNYDNLRTALHRSLNQESSVEAVEMGARLANCLWIIWYYIKLLKEGSSWLSSALQRYPKPNRTRARLLMSDGAVAWYLSNLQMATTRLREAFELFSLLEDTSGLASTLYLFGHVMFDQQNYSEARRIFKESLSYFESLGNSVFQNILLHDLGLVACHQGDLKLAREYYERSLAYFIQGGFRGAASSVYIRLGDIVRMEGDYERAEEVYQRSMQIERVASLNPRMHAWVLLKLGFVMLNRSDINQAQSLFCEGLALQHDSGNQQGVAECLVGLGSAKVMSEEDEQAAVCFAAARQILTRTGQPISPADEAEWKRYEAVARPRCDQQRFEQAWSRGSQAVIDDLVAAVMSDTLDRFTQDPEVNVFIGQGTKPNNSLC